MPNYYCPEDCKFQNECSVKKPLQGDRFTNNSSDEICWCYFKALSPLKDTRSESQKRRGAGFHDWIGNNQH
jgi:hypothetical protein